MRPSRKASHQVRSSQAIRIVCALAWVAAFDPSPAMAEPVDVSGVLNLDYGMDFDGDSVLSRASLELTAFTRPAHWLSLTGIGRAQVDLSDRLEPGKPDQDNRSPASRRLFIGDKGEMELRELYADISIGDIFVRAGKQQIVWGQADGLKVLDVVNPQSYREFVLDKFDSSRTPLWSIAAQIPHGDVMLELVWVPDTTYADIPSADAFYAISSPQLVLPPTPGKRPVIADTDRPGAVIADSDIGFNLSAPAGNWDLTLNYLYQYNNLPQYRYTDDATTTTIRPVYLRTHMAGGSFSRSIDDFTLRGELAYFSNRPFTIDRTIDSVGSVTRSEVSYMIGVDWIGLSKTFVSAQLFQSDIPNYRSGIIRDAHETNVTGLIRYTFNHDRTKLGVRDVTSVNHGDGYVEFSVYHELMDGVGIGAQIVQFYGEARGLFGEFNDRDHGRLSLSISL